MEIPQPTPANHVILHVLYVQEVLILNAKDVLLLIYRLEQPVLLDVLLDNTLSLEHVTYALANVQLVLHPHYVKPAQQDFTYQNHSA
jgi:hypothetical protein